MLIMSVVNRPIDVGNCTLMPMTLRADGRFGVEQETRPDQWEVVTPNAGYTEREEAQRVADLFPQARVFDWPERKRQQQALREQEAHDQKVIAEGIGPRAQAEADEDQGQRLLDERYATVTDEELSHHGTWEPPQQRHRI